jgi:hypothetical protein
MGDFPLLLELQKTNQTLLAEAYRRRSGWYTEPTAAAAPVQWARGRSI